MGRGLVLVLVGESTRHGGQAQGPRNRSLPPLVPTQMRLHAAHYRCLPATTPHRSLSLRRWQPDAIHRVLMESESSGSMRRWDALGEAEKVTRIIHRLNAL